MKESTGEKPNPWTSSALPASPSTPTPTSGRLSGQFSPLIDQQSGESEDTQTEVDSALSSLFEVGPSRESRDIAEQSELHAILGPGTRFEGTLSFAGRIRIDGEFSGQVLGGQVLVIGEGAHVRGELQARQVIVLGGVVEANISASISIELYRPAQVVGDLRSPQIYMDKGIQFQGTCDMTQKS